MNSPLSQNLPFSTLNHSSYRVLINEQLQAYARALQEEGVTGDAMKEHYDLAQELECGTGKT
jgi:hypothetical protein